MGRIDHLPLLGFRKRIIIWVFDLTQKWYVLLFKNSKGWSTSKELLLDFPEYSLGKHLGVFLYKHNYQLLPKVERHDVYHVLTNYGTKVEEEIGLQFLCLGNGKRSIYLFGALIAGTILLPDYFEFYLQSYQFGKTAHPFHHYNYEGLLEVPLKDLQFVFFGSIINPRPISTLKTLLS